MSNYKNQASWSSGSVSWHRSPWYSLQEVSHVEAFRGTTAHAVIHPTWIRCKDGNMLILSMVTPLPCPPLVDRKIRVKLWQRQDVQFLSRCLYDSCGWQSMPLSNRVATPHDNNCCLAAEWIAGGCDRNLMFQLWRLNLSEIIPYPLKSEWVGHIMSPNIVLSICWPNHCLTLTRKVT